MLVLLKKYHNLKTVAIAALLSVIALSANAQISNNTNTNIIGDAFESLPNLNFSASEGYKNEFDYNYNHDSDGVNFSAGYNSKYRYDWGKYVNTSSKKVTLINVNAGIKSDMKLGCKGIEGGLEALFEFDAGEILEYLPQYILTNLAVEALAQIYATPLISTVMDGLKAMQNWVAEMKQASCNMSKVMDRSEEIRAGRVQDCISENMPANGKVTSAIMSDCEDPGKLAQMLEDAKNYMGTKKSTTYSVHTALGVPTDEPTLQGFTNSDGEPLTASQSQTIYEENKKVDDANAQNKIFSFLGARYSQGKLTSMFLPDVTFKLNGGGAKEESEPRLNASKVYGKAKRSAYNAVFGIYNDIQNAFNRKGVIKSKDKAEIIDYTNEYLDKLMAYGSRGVFTDDDSLNSDVYTAEDIEKIENDFEFYHSIIYSSSNAKTGFKKFIIGPKSGPTKPEHDTSGIDLSRISADETEFKHEAKDYLLQAGNRCFAKVKGKKASAGSTDKYYTWTRLDLSPKAIFSRVDLDDNQTISDSIITNASICNALNQLDLTTLNMMMTEGKYYGKAYMENIAARSAFNTATIITNSVVEQLSGVIKNNESSLADFCKSVGLSGLPETAVYGGISGKAYNSCNDYVKQNKMSIEKVEAIKLDIQNFKDKLLVLEENKKQAEKDYEMTYQLMLSNKQTENN